jgi:pyruvate-ferredoxin/flavodoxin oxidoreductase
MELPMTFADFAVSEVHFRKQFRIAPPDTWNENMVPLAEFLEMDEDEREDRFPYIWSVDREQKLSRLLVAKPIVESCEDRRHFWTMLRSLAGVYEPQESREEIAAAARQEVVSRIAGGLMQLAGGAGGADAAVAALAAPGGAVAAPAGAPDSAGDYMAPWIDTEECTACDECTQLNSRIFVYNADKKAVIQEPEGGPYRDLVKSAERCTAQVIHPGLPRDRSAKDIDKWIKRGEKFN